MMAAVIFHSPCKLQYKDTSNMEPYHLKDCNPSAILIKKQSCTNNDETDIVDPNDDLSDLSDSSDSFLNLQIDNQNLIGF